MISGSNIKILCDLEIFPMDIISKVAIKYREKYLTEFSRTETNGMVITFKSKNEDIILEDEFKNKFMEELLFQYIRFNVGKQTKTIKELMIGRALFETCVVASRKDRLL